MKAARKEEPRGPNPLRSPALQQISGFQSRRDLRLKQYQWWKSESVRQDVPRHAKPLGLGLGVGMDEWEELSGGQSVTHVSGGVVMMVRPISR